MIPLSKDKRNKLILVGLGTLVALAALWFGLIRTQRSSLAKLDQQKTQLENTLHDVRDAIGRADEIEAEVGSVSRQLAALEEGMASGDLYSWIINSIRRFKLPHKVDIPQFSQIVVADMNLLPKFPYKQATVTVAGTAYYHDLGKFVADFENEFPHSRVVKLEIEAASSPTEGESEKLSFKMDIVTLIKPTPS